MNRHLQRIFIVDFISLLAGLWTIGQAQLVDAPGYGSREKVIFEKIEPIIRHGCRVPLRLPRFLRDEKQPIYAIAQPVTRFHYKILLATELSCNGQNSCLYGSIQGSATPFKLDKNIKPFKVSLMGHDGQFIKPVCHEYCSEAFVQWREGGFYYSIGIKAERMHSLIGIADSAIGGPPPPLSAPKP
jgi:hypothetical protein